MYNNFQWKSCKYSELLFPGIITTIDCVHIKIQSPGGDNTELYRNDIFSINGQGICDYRLKFQDIISCWPGSVYDSTIFNDSPVDVDFERGIYRNFSCFEYCSINYLYLLAIDLNDNFDHMD